MCIWSVTILIWSRETWSVFHNPSSEMSFMTEEIGKARSSHLKKKWTKISNCCFYHSLSPDQLKYISPVSSSMSPASTKSFRGERPSSVPFPMLNTLFSPVVLVCFLVFLQSRSLLALHWYFWFWGAAFPLFFIGMEYLYVYIFGPDASYIWPASQEFIAYLDPAV